MSSNKVPTPQGYSHVPVGHVASVVTCLEMDEKPAFASVRFPDGIKLDRMIGTDSDVYRALFRKIGANWLWYSRLVMSDDELSSILSDRNVDIYILKDRNEDIGFIELDFRVPGQCEVVFFGLTPNVTGRGLGRAMMASAIELAWGREITRLWLHTCTFDHPSALGFYIRSGFKPYSYLVETQPDPRLTGHLPTNSAPHVPLIRPAITSRES